MNLLEFPEEVLTQVIESTDPPTFSSLSLTCRPLGRLCVSPSMQKRMKQKFLEEIHETTSYGTRTYYRILGHGKHAKHADYEARWRSGAVRVQGHYRQGKKEGAWVYRTREGREEKRGKYREGKKEGPWVEYYSNGTPFQEGQYTEGQPYGVWTAWYPHGKKFDQRNYGCPTAWYRKMLRFLSSHFAWTERERIVLPLAIGLLLWILGTCWLL